MKLFKRLRMSFMMAIFTVLYGIVLFYYTIRAEAGNNRGYFNCKKLVIRHAYNDTARAYRKAKWLNR